MKYAVQYANEVEIFLDTKPITKEEAIVLFYDNLEDFKERWLAGEDVHLCVWEDVGENLNYADVLIELDSRDTVVENGKVYKVKKELLNIADVLNK